MKLYNSLKQASDDIPKARRVMQYNQADIFLPKEVAENPYTGKQYAIAMYSGLNGEFFGYY